MKRFLYSILFFSLGMYFPLLAQEQIHGLPHVYQYELVHTTDTIQFICVTKELETPKPTLLFCQGSLPKPLVMEYADTLRYIPNLNNFDYLKIAERYNIIMISMPYVPVIVNEKNTNDQGSYILNPQNPRSFPQQYVDANYPDNYVERAHIVLASLTGMK